MSNYPQVKNHWSKVSEGASESTELPLERTFFARARIAERIHWPTQLLVLKVLELI